MMDATEHQYRSGEARTDMITGVVGLIYTVVFVCLNPDTWKVALVFVAFTGYLILRAVRGWRLPYVRLDSERIVVFEHGRPKHYVELAAVASVRQGFNRTVLLMRDGVKIPVSHLGFMFSNDARDFRQRLAARLESAVG